MRIVWVLIANLGLSALAIGAAALVLAADRLWPIRLPVQVVPLAWPCLIVGAGLITLAVATFLSVAHASGAAGDAPARLVVAGPFRRLRNPIYLGAGLLLFAVAFYRRSPSFLLAALVYLPAIDAYVRRVEEPRLAARFGQEYAEYRRAVPRWLPGRPGRIGAAGGGLGDSEEGGLRLR